MPHPPLTGEHDACAGFLVFSLIQRPTHPELCKTNIFLCSMTIYYVWCMWPISRVLVQMNSVGTLSALWLCGPKPNQTNQPNQFRSNGNETFWIGVKSTKVQVIRFNHKSWAFRPLNSFTLTLKRWHRIVYFCIFVSAVRPLVCMHICVRLFGFYFVSSDTGQTQSIRFSGQWPMARPW